MTLKDLVAHLDRIRQLGLHPLSEVVVSDGTVGGELSITAVTIERGRVMIHPDLSDMDVFAKETEERE